ncbi:hypothetical protein C5O80_13350 [Burkholderia sp. SRS-46]|nr:hypothetical protein C5O80_13350 [Burkholderia sp. SRS-46]
MLAAACHRAHAGRDGAARVMFPISTNPTYNKDRPVDAQSLIPEPAVAPAPLRAQLLAEWRATLAATLHVAPDALDADLPLVDAGFTSVELIDLVVRCQLQHAIAFPPERLVGLTLASLVDGIVEALGAVDAAKDAS